MHSFPGLYTVSPNDFVNFGAPEPFSNCIKIVIDIASILRYHWFAMNTPLLDRLSDLRRRLTWLRDGL